MNTSRDEFTEKTKKIMQQRVGNRCSNPDCRCLTSGPNHHPEKSTIIGVGAHITAAAENGPRYDSSLNPEDRRSILNGIWLCQNCSKLIDSDPLIYTVGLIQRWKSHAEELARLEMEGKDLPAEQLYEGYFCPHCDTFSKKGLTVCLGCNSDIYYGSTPTAWRNDVQLGMMSSFLIYAVAFTQLPSLLNSQFGTSFPFGWGLPFIGVLIGGAITTIGGGWWFAKRKDLQRREQPPIFVRKRN